MPDRLVNLSRSPAARKLVGTLGVSLPPTLKRDAEPWRERFLADQDVQVLLPPHATLAAVIADTLAQAGASAHVLGEMAEFERAGEAWSQPPAPLDDGRCAAIILDGSGIRDVDQLNSLYTLLHERVRSVSSSGRVLILGAEPAAMEDPVAAATQQALEGFTRSLAKELGRKGSTANLIRVAPGAADRLPAVLRFLLSYRSAFISGQPIRVSATVRGTALKTSRPLDTKLALVTGSARGIGAATARTLAREGARVIVLDRPDDADAAQELAREIGGLALAVDVTAPDAGAQITAFVKAHGDGLDVLVHNAGVTRDKTLARMSAPQWDLVIDVNLRAILTLTAELDPILGDDARIVCLSSIGGIAGNPGQTNYGATKAGVIGFVRALAPRLASRGIAVNAVAPGLIETRMTAAMPVATREVARRLANLSQGGLPQDIAEVVTFLSSPGASSLCGEVVRVCGGNLVGA